MLILKDISIAELSVAYATKTTPIATLCMTNGKDHEEPVQVDVFSLTRHGNGEDLIDVAFEYWGPKKQREREGPISHRGKFVYTRSEKIAKQHRS